MIRLKDIYKYYDSKFQRTFVLKDIDLSIEEGEFISIMGPSGAGKSTLLNILGLLDEPSEGEYHFYGEPVHNLKEKQKTEYHRHYIGFIFQAYHLIDELTVYENIETPLIYKKVKTKERKAIVADMLDRFNIVAKADLFPEQLSGGQQQLVGIARAIAGKPKLLLADEPTGNLDSKTAGLILHLFENLVDRGKTILMVTHDNALARRAQSTIVLADGVIVDQQTNGSGVMVSGETHVRAPL